MTLFNSADDDFAAPCNAFKFSEYDLYAYYLDKAEIEYKYDNSLDYDKIYEALKYNIVNALAGGDKTIGEYGCVKFRIIRFKAS